MSIETKTLSARLATLHQLSRDLIPNFIAPVPSDKTLRAWFADAGIPSFKSNPNAKRGGGHVYYSVPHVERLFRARLRPAGGGH